MASIRDVAKRANVGPATVSRVLNNSGYVSEETRKRIEKAIEELSYAPNELARNLFKKQAGIIALIVPDIRHPFFSEFVGYAEEELFRAGYKAMICNAAHKDNVEQEYLEMLERHIVDGIITDIHTLDVEAYKQLDKPIVALDRYLGKNIPVVSADHTEGGRLAAEHLAENGCRRVLHIRTQEMFKAPFQDRHREFSRVMKENGIEEIPFELESNQFSFRYYREAVRGIFDRGVEFDGVFGGDLPVIECMNECRRRNIRIPEDVRLVAYDGTHVTDLTEPRLTAVAQPTRDLARETVRVLLNRDGSDAAGERHIKLPVTLKKGGTTL